MPPQEAAPSSSVCIICHAPILPSYYFCPNCGTNLRPAPLPTDSATQLKLYAFSVVLPMICFLFVTRWKGMQYLRSKDEKARSVGYIAAFLLVASTVAVAWYAYTWTQQQIQQSINQINADMSF
jgi:hypothetical protein